MEFRYGSKYGSKSIDVAQYDTAKEKSILIMLMQDINHVHFDILDEALLILGYNKLLVQSLTKMEKRIILLKCRELSVGDDITFNFPCTKCGVVNTSIVRTDNFFINKLDDSTPKLNNAKYSLIEPYINNPKVEDCLIIDEDVLDDMSSIEYDHISDEINEYVMGFRTSITGYCTSCKTAIPINLSDELIVENMSEDSLQSIYKTYSDMIYFGKYSKKDIDSMFPFERTIFVGMLNATKKELT